MFGAFMALYLKTRIDKRLEIKYIKISLDDELSEIISIISKMDETFSKTSRIPNEYLNDLDSSTESFHHNRNKLYMIAHDDLRREILSFYKSLEVSVVKYQNKVDTLALPTPGEAANHELVAVMTTFREHSSRASAIKSTLKKYCYYLLWIPTKGR